LGCGVEDLADQPTYPVGKLGGQTGDAAAGQVGGPVVRAAQLGQDLKDREQKPQLTGDRALAGELADDQLLDPFIGFLNDALVGFHRVGGLLVSPQSLRVTPRGREK